VAPAPSPDGAASIQVEAATIHLPENAFHLHHYYDLLTRRQIDLYQRDGAGAWERLEERWRGLEKSTLLRVQMIRIEMRFLRARCALAAPVNGNQEELLHAADVAARSIERERMAWGDPHARLIRATVVARRGDAERAVTELRAALEGFEAAGMALLAAVCRRRLGELLGGEEGQGLVDAANEWMVAQRIVSPERMADLYAPGFATSSG